MKPADLTVEQIAEAVGMEKGIPAHRILSTHRGAPADAWARACAMWLYKNLVPSRTWSDVGRAFNRDRTTVRHACVRYEARWLRIGASFDSPQVRADLVTINLELYNLTVDPE